MMHNKDNKSWLGRWLPVLKITVAIVLLLALCRAADWRKIFHAVEELNWSFLAVAMGLFVPQTLVSAGRWRALVREIAPISLVQAIRHTLAASAWNLVLPSKLGDFSKAGMLPITEPRRRVAAGSLLLIEKAGDVSALLVWIVVGTIISKQSWSAVGALAIACVGCAISFSRSFWGGSQVRKLFGGCRFAISCFGLWGLHLLQVHFFLQAAGVSVGWETTATKVPVAIFAGLIPISWWGIGTRDSTLIWLFADIAPMHVMALVGLLTTSRYLIPGAMGIPFVLGSWKKTVSSSPSLISKKKRSFAQQVINVPIGK